MDEMMSLGARRGKNMDWVTQFEGQMLVCGLLAKALYGEPDREWLAELIADRVLENVPFGSDLVEIDSAVACFRTWHGAEGDGLGEASFGAIVEDYTQLFVGPGYLPAAPWESVYTNKDRAVFQMETANVKNWYKRFELALASSYNEPADHVGLEFGFLADLAERTIAASNIRDGGEVKRLVDAQRGFLSQHMLRWIPRWANDVIEQARTEYYRGLGWLARATVLEAGSFFAATEQPVRHTGPFRRDAGTAS